MREILRAIFEAEDKTSDVIPDIYEKGVNGQQLKADDGQVWSFYKSHSKNEVKRNSGVEFENDFIIYIVRRPHDVFCSQLNYLLRRFEKNRGGILLSAESVDSAQQQGMISDLFSAFCVYGTLDPYFIDAGNYVENVTNWLEIQNKEPERVMFIKYEDMTRDIVEALSPLADKLGISRKRLENAAKLAEQRTNDGGKFFWKKQSETYKEYLSPTDIAKFAHYHGELLNRLGY